MFPLHLRWSCDYNCCSMINAIVFFVFLKLERKKIAGDPNESPATCRNDPLTVLSKGLI